MASLSFLSGLGPMDIRRLNLLTALQLRLISWDEYLTELEKICKETGQSQKENEEIVLEAESS